MSKRFAWIAALLLAALLLAGCGAPSGKKPESHTRGYNTPENLAAFQASGLFEPAEGYAVYSESFNFNRSGAEVDGPGRSKYRIDAHAPTATPEGPFLAVAVREDDDRKPVWSVCGGSAEAMDLEGVRTLAVCVISERHASYQSDRHVYTGIAEDAKILYIDAQTGACVAWTELDGKALPMVASGGAPHYTLDDEKLVSQVVKDMTTPFALTDEGEITGGKLADMENGYRFPDSVRKITKLEIGDGVDQLVLPASIEAIADGVIPRSVATSGNLDDPMVLTVEPDTYAETFARENGYPYSYPEDEEYTGYQGNEEALRIWVAESECGFYNTRTHFTRLELPLAPDGDLAAFITLQRRSDKKNAEPEAYYVLIVEPDSPAEAYAKAHQYPYCYAGESNVCRFRVDGRDWYYDLWHYVVAVPDGVPADDAVLAWMLGQARKALVEPDSPAAEACREAGLTCWTGDIDAAERAFETEDGLAWRVAYSFRRNELFAVHIPEDYVQTDGGAPLERIDMLRLLEDIGYGDGKTYPNRYPLCYVQPGSWAAGAAQAWVEEGSTTLHMADGTHDYVNPNGRYISESTCDAIDQIVDANFEYIDREDAERMLLDRGVRALYSEAGPNGYVDLSFFCRIDAPERMYMRTSADRWHINNGKTLEGIRVLRIWNDALDDDEERSWICQRAAQDELFTLEVVEGSEAERFARENDIPYETWDPQSEPFCGE